MIAALGLVLSMTMGMAAFAINGALAMRVGAVGEDAGIFFAIQNGLLGMSAIGNVIVIVAVSAIAIRSGFLPSWLAYGGAAAAVVVLVGALAVATQSAVIAVIGIIGFLLSLAWIAAISLVLYERKGSATAAA